MSENEAVLDPKRGLVVKLCEIMAAVGYLQKKGTNQSQGYKYLKEADVAEAMRTEFAKRNVFIFPSVVKNERVRLERSKTYKDVTESKVTYATDIEVNWTFVDGDTGQERTCLIPGCSESPGDKGVYVAMTGSEKYMLMKSFLLPTGDDPEDDSNETDGKGSSEAAQKVASTKIAAHRASKGSTELPEQLTVLKTGEDEYRIQGDPVVMDAHRGLLLAYGERGKENGKPAPYVVMTGEKLEEFKFQFQDQRGGLLTNLKPMRESPGARAHALLNMDPGKPGVEG